MIVVHHLNESRSQRILWLLEELGLPYEVAFHQRDPKTRQAPEALRAIHPLGKSPVISDGERVVAESGAIIEYLIRRHGGGRLRPDPDGPDFDAYVFWMHHAEGSALPALIIRINVARVGEAANPVLPRLDDEVATQLRFLDDSLAGHAYLLGVSLTAADVQMSFVGELAAARFGLAEYPRVLAWVRRFQARPAYRRALARGGDYPLVLPAT